MFQYIQYMTITRIDIFLCYTAYDDEKSNKPENTQTHEHTPCSRSTWKHLEERKVVRNQIFPFRQTCPVTFPQRSHHREPCRSTIGRACVRLRYIRKKNLSKYTHKWLFVIWNKVTVSDILSKRNDPTDTTFQDLSFHTCINATNFSDISQVFEAIFSILPRLQRDGSWAEWGVSIHVLIVIVKMTWSISEAHWFLPLKTKLNQNECYNFFHIVKWWNRLNTKI